MLSMLRSAGRVGVQCDVISCLLMNTYIAKGEGAASLVQMSQCSKQKISLPLKENIIGMTARDQ